MRKLLTVILLACLVSFCFADKPFPDNKANHWVYASMIQIKKNRLWYRLGVKAPAHKVLTRTDMATKTLYLAVDSQSLVEKFRQTTLMVGKKPDNASTRKWVARYKANFPKKKKLYQDYVQRVTKLWNYFRPEIKSVAKSLKVDPKVITQNLALEKITVDSMRLPKSAGALPGKKK